MEQVSRVRPCPPCLPGTQRPGRSCFLRARVGADLKCPHAPRGPPLLPQGAAGVGRLSCVFANWTR